MEYKNLKDMERVKKIVEEMAKGRAITSFKDFEGLMKEIDNDVPFIPYDLVAFYSLLCIAYAYDQINYSEFLNLMFEMAQGIDKIKDNVKIIVAKTSRADRDRIYKVYINGVKDIEEMMPNTVHIIMPFVLLLVVYLYSDMDYQALLNMIFDLAEKVDMEKENAEREKKANK